MTVQKTILEPILEHARVQPEAPAIIQEGHTGISYGQLSNRIHARETQFSNAGVKPNDFCGFIASQGAEFITASLGVLAAGGCLVPIPEDHRSRTDSPYVHRLPLDCVMDEENDFDPQFLESRPEEGEKPEIDGEPAYVRFTSGTTSNRKGVLIGHQSILERTAAANKGLKIGTNDRIMWLLPMVHHYVVSILLYLRYGATIVLPERKLAQPILSCMRTHRTTVLYATPFHYRMLAGAEDSDSLETLRLAVSTATGLSENTAMTFQHQYQQPVSQALGIIEVGLPVINLRNPEDKPTSLGQVLPDYQIHLLDENGAARSTSTQEPGEICIQGPGLFDAYLDPVQQSEEVLGEHGFRTGDQGFFDEDGDLFLSGRRENRIDVAGMKMFCEEVEEVLNRHPEVQESQVYGEDHPKLGQIPKAKYTPVRPDNPPEEKQLKEHCRNDLEPHQVPRSFRVVEEIPRTPTGKIKRTNQAGT